MKNIKPIVLSIAGYDPCGGAGVLADIKTMEQHHVTGFAVTTAITYQTESNFDGLDWLPEEQVIRQLETLLAQYTPEAIKIGLISYALLEKVLAHIPDNIPIVWDPIISASAGYEFENFSPEQLSSILQKVELVTPNIKEYEQLKLKGATECNVLLKGGHAVGHSNDCLIYNFGSMDIIRGVEFSRPYMKHGTGCVLSSAIASNLALGKDLKQSCTSAKKYVEAFLQSNDSLLGYHVRG